jgi:hypothetical protein
MAIKIYQDGTTKELVISNGPISGVSSGTQERRYPAFSEVARVNYNDTHLSIKSVSTNSVMLDPTIFSQLQNEAGTAYASFAALKTALDGYFDATI